MEGDKRPGDRAKENVKEAVDKDHKAITRNKQIHLIQQVLVMHTTK